jgi:hypothetical protein
MSENGLEREFWDYFLVAFVFLFLAFCYVTIHDSLTSIPADKENNGLVIVE